MVAPLASHEVRSELDILVVLYKSVFFVTVSIGEISFSLLERLEANYEWGSRAITSLGLLSSPLTRCNFRFKLAGKQSILNAKRCHLAAKRPHPLPLGTRGALKLPQRVRAEPGRQTFSGAF